LTTTGQSTVELLSEHLGFLQAAVAPAAALPTYILPAGARVATK
jgi:hypothetical protein